ncbi:Retinol dehydrogenase 13 [Pleurostoma richardsiae]|uniref:Retinol dehydrogenase 13 n=1 Tax=Pleurostoma richardsiae TaxID=41990 RepID=A0AA38RAR4_9PEZI|nr:Retinol dehydrogenase 13 [Pleurostoma richardsiae]
MSPFGFNTTSEEVVSAFAGNVRGRTFLITGPSAKSLAAYAATSLAKESPEHIILVGRNKAKIDPVIDAIKATDAKVKVIFVQCDLSDQDSVRKAAGEINSNPDIKKIDVVINCAGVMDIEEYTLDKKGNELTFSANHIGHFLLTNLIMPKILAAGKGARIVNVTSHGHRVSPVRFDDPAFSGGKTYDGWSAYGQSKTANMLFSVELARRLADRGVYSFSVHPGGILDTGLAQHLEMKAFDQINEIAIRNTGRPFQVDHPFKTTSEGTSSILAAALDPAFESQSGIFIQDCQAGSPFEYAVDPENAKKLWTLTEELVGEKFSP